MIISRKDEGMAMARQELRGDLVIFLNVLCVCVRACVRACLLALRENIERGEKDIQMEG